MSSTSKKKRNARAPTRGIIRLLKRITREPIADPAYLDREDYMEVDIQLNLAEFVHFYEILDHLVKRVTLGKHDNMCRPRSGDVIEIVTVSPRKSITRQIILNAEKDYNMIKSHDLVVAYRQDSPYLFYAAAFK